MENVMEFLPFMLEGSVMTVELFAITLVLSLPLGLPFALGSNSRIWPIKIFCRIYVWIFRGTPLLLQLFFFYFFFPLVLGWQISGFTAAVLTYVLNYAAYFAEIFRGGIEAIPKGQHEASAALGFTKVQTFFRIILPQVVKRIVPAGANEVITLVKDTSLASVIAYIEIFRKSRELMVTYSNLIPLFIAGVFYFAMNAILTVAFSAIEKKLDYYK